MLHVRGFHTSSIAYEVTKKETQLVPDQRSNILRLFYTCKTNSLDTDYVINEFWEQEDLKMKYEIKV